MKALTYLYFSIDNLTNDILCVEMTLYNKIYKYIFIHIYS